MTRLSLAELDDHEIDHVVAHPDQREAAQLIAELVEELRGLAGVGDTYELQRELGGAIYVAEQRLQEASRNTKRAAAGRSVR